jgi:predicted phosphodiesterase
MNSSQKRFHQFRLTGLKQNQKYFYVASVTDSNHESIASERLSFRTAPGVDDSYTFVAIGDTQSQADVVKRVSDLAYMHRPNLVVHAGDLVDTGTVKAHWTDHFFPAMQPLIGRVPFMPVLGNHEQDADHYYDYMDLPQPEMYYSFEFGNAEFFMIDGNRTLQDESEQLKWLESALKQSDSKWKFAVLHQPPYTSDSDDYGDTYLTISTRGDTNVQNIISLLEEYGVDICFSGHVHDYERTFPILKGKVTPMHQGGVTYVTTAGGGGYLEHFDPTNTWFGHKKVNCHHFVYIAVHGDQLEFQAIDEHGRLFDVMTIYKSTGHSN